MSCRMLCNLPSHSPRDCKDPQKKALLQDEVANLRAKLSLLKGEGVPLEEAIQFPVLLACMPLNGVALV